MGRFVLLVVGIWMTVATPALAVLGESPSAARRREATWRQRYGAVAPIINVEGGRVVQECWSAPPDGWNQSTALDFARQLLPASVRTESFESLPPDGATKGYEIEGYRIYTVRHWQSRLEDGLTRDSGGTACAA